MMRRALVVVLAGAFALLPAAAQAQSGTVGATTASQPAADTVPGAARPATSPPAGTGTPPESPADLAEETRSELATTPAPENPAPGLAAPAGAAGGSLSPALAAGADHPAFEHLAPTGAVGQPDGDWTIQEQFTPVGIEGRFFADRILLPLMAIVTLIVFVLLTYAMFTFRARDHRVPSKTSHNTMIEVVWTLAPVLVLIFVAIPSFRLLANQYDPPPADITIKAVGHQWYWSYEYPDHGVSFDAVMLTEQETEERSLPRLLETDNRVVVPAGATVKVLVTSEDVIHSWAIPSFWVKMDAVPGRLNETWFKVDRPGVYYGQCSELCGTRHAFMPIAVEALPPERFREWVLSQGGRFPAGPSAAEAAAPTATPAAGGGAPPAAAAPATAPPQAAAPAKI